MFLMFRTCVFLRPHWSIDHPLEGSYPIPLLGFGLTGKQEFPVRGDDGDAVVPVVALCGRGQAGQDGVAVLLTADEHLAAGVGILGDRQRERKSCKQTQRLIRTEGQVMRAQVSSYQRVFEIHEPPVVHGEPPLLEALRVLSQTRDTVTFWSASVNKLKPYLFFRLGKNQMLQCLCREVASRHCFILIVHEAKHLETITLYT